MEKWRARRKAPCPIFMDRLSTEGWPAVWTSTVISRDKLGPPCFSAAESSVQDNDLQTREGGEMDSKTHPKTKFKKKKINSVTAARYLLYRRHRTRSYGHGDSVVAGWVPAGLEGQGTGW